MICVFHNNDWHNCDWLSFTFNIHTVFWCSKCRWQAKDRTLETRTHTQLSFLPDGCLPVNQPTKWLRERTEYVPQLWNWENHWQSQWRGSIYRVVWFFHLRLSCVTHLILFSERLPLYAICVVQDNLGWKNRATRYNCRFSATSLALRVIFLGWTTTQRII